MKKYLAIDIGKTSLKYAVINEELDFSDKGKEYISTVDSKDELFDAIRDVADQFRGEVEGVTITMPGVIDTKKGFAYSGGVYPWARNIPYAQMLSDHIGMKVAIANDAKACAFAEMGYGSLKKVQNGVLYMILATGIGGAVISNGQLLNGEHFGAGEFSYMRGDYMNRESTEDMFALACSIDGLSRIVEAVSGLSNLNVFRIFSKVQMGDELVRQGVETYCDMLATYIYNVQCVLDSQRIVMGGNITDEPVFMKMIKEAVHRKFEDARFKFIREPEIRGCVFSGTARMIGAMYNYKQIFEDGEKEKE